MSLDNSNIKNIAWLARLEMPEEEVSGYQQDLSNILDLVETMNRVDTSALEPLAHPLEINARLRSDEITEQDQKELFQSIAPDVDDGHYLVPKVIE